MFRSSIRARVLIVFLTIIVLVLALQSTLLELIQGAYTEQPYRGIIEFVLLLAALLYLPGFLSESLCRPFSELRRDMERVVGSNLQTESLSPRLGPSNLEEADRLRQVYSSLLEKVAAHLQKEDLLYHMSKALPMIRSLDQILQTVVDTLSSYYRVKYAYIFMREENEAAYTVRAGYGFPFQPENAPILRPGEGITGWVAKMGQPLLVTEVQKDPRYVQAFADVVSELAAPIQANGKTIGVLNLESDRPDAFDEQALKTVTTIVSQLGTTIENFGLFEESHRRISELTTLVETIDNLQSATDSQEIARIIGASVERLFPKAHYLIRLLDDQSQLRLATTNLDSSEENLLAQPMNPEDCLAYRRGKPIILGSGATARQCPHFLSKEGMRVALCVPLPAGGKTLGVLRAASSNSFGFTRTRRDLLSALGEEAAGALYNLKLRQELEQKVGELSTLYEVAATLSSTIELEKHGRSPVKMAMSLSARDVAFLGLFTGDGEELEVQAFLGVSQETVLGWQLSHGHGLLARLRQEKRPITLYDSPDGDPESALSLTFRSLLLLPLGAGEKVIGLLGLGSRQHREFGSDEIKILYLLANRAAMAIENAQLYESTQRLANADPLMGLFNHRYFQEHLQEEILRASRFNHPVSLVMIDLDHFKKFNDTYGHPSGDQVLRQLARLINSQIRQVDIAARYGGEELAIILPETNKAGAAVLAEKLRRTIENHLFFEEKHQMVSRLTISLGVAAYPDDAQTREELVEKADQALYQAKTKGRNRVSLA
ncbi:MAG: sensor domain-containing diguanylate cyclase [Firmicutes bacterium]|nr:sensor domain-containing diguanylate cyclase [Bacillota bacterium]